MAAQGYPGNRRTREQVRHLGVVDHAQVLDARRQLTGIARPGEQQSRSRHAHLGERLEHQRQPAQGAQATHVQDDAALGFAGHAELRGEGAVGDADGTASRGGESRGEVLIGGDHPRQPASGGAFGPCGDRGDGTPQRPGDPPLGAGGLAQVLVGVVDDGPAGHPLQPERLRQHLRIVHVVGVGVHGPCTPREVPAGARAVRARYGGLEAHHRGVGPRRGKGPDLLVEDPHVAWPVDAGQVHHPPSVQAGAGRRVRGCDGPHAGPPRGEVVEQVLPQAVVARCPFIGQVGVVPQERGGAAGPAHGVQHPQRALARVSGIQPQV